MMGLNIIGMSLQWLGRKYRMGYIGQPLNAGNLSVQTGTGDGADTTPIATLDYSVGSSESLAIYLDGVKQAVATYTASGTTLTFTTAPPNGVGIEVVFLALPISLPTPGDNTVGLNQLNTTGTPDGSLFLRDDLVWSGAGGITQGTAVASTSGTSIDFTGIPAGTKRIIFSYSGLSLNGSSNTMIQLGDAGGFETTGYTGGSGYVGSTGVLMAVYSTGFKLLHGEGATTVVHGIMVLTLLDASTFTWCASNTGQMSDVLFGIIGGGDKSLSAELTQIRLTTVNGTDTFDAGKVNIQYE